VNRAQRAVTVFFVPGDDTEPVNIAKSRKPLIFFLHLAPDRKRLLGPPEHVGLDPGLFQLAAHVTGDPVDHVTGFALQRDKATDDRLTPLGVKHPERQVFQFLAHPLHTHAACQRCVDVHGFASLLNLLVFGHRFDRAHVVQPVGQLDQNDAQVLGHGHKQLAEILGLLGLVAGQLQIGQLGHPIDQHRHLVAKAFFNLAVGRFGVFDRVVQQGCDDRGVIQTLFGQDRGHSHGMRKIGFARFAELPVMHIQPIGIGPGNAVDVGLGIVVADQSNQIFD